jgi:hypothetical protein
LPDISMRTRVPAKLYSGAFVFSTNMVFLDEWWLLANHYSPPVEAEKRCSGRLSDDKIP